MGRLFWKVWVDDDAFIVSTEMLFIAAILVIGIVAGLAALRFQIVAAFTRLGNSIAALNPGYFVQPVTSGAGGSGGTSVTYTPTTTVIILSRAAPANDPAGGAAIPPPPAP